MGPPPPLNGSKVKAYSRGQGLSQKVLRKTGDKKAKGIVRAHESKIHGAALKAVQAEILSTHSDGFLHPETSLERTYKVKQRDIAESVGITAANKAFDLRFAETDGPYCLDYSRNGKYLLMGGQASGHIASFDWKTGQLGCESTLRSERVFDIKWLHNETMFAVAQSKNAYIYDSSGVEVHALRKHADARHLDFLPFHMLLASSGTTGVLRYQDMTTGVILNEIKSRLGPSLAMAQNPANAIIHLGHGNGTVTLWSPNCGTPLVKMLCHRGPLAAIAVDLAGHYMATAGLDNQLKLWDLRTFKPLDQYFTRAAPAAVSFSQRGLLAVAYGSSVAIWKDVCKEKQKSPYLSHQVPGAALNDVQFCPFDDTLGLGHALGISSILVPGAGEPNFDSLEANPFETKKQRREAEVRHVMTKIQPDLISLDTDFIGKIKDDHSVVLEWNRRVAHQATSSEAEASIGLGRQRAKSSTLRRYLKKDSNVIDPKRQALKERLEKEKQRLAAKKLKSPNKPWTALGRFGTKDNI